MKPVLTYFPVRGRAEPIRMLLWIAGVEFHDRHVPLEQWDELRPSTPFGGLPVYEEGDLKLAQAPVILRYLARKHGLAGEDEAQALRCEMTCEAMLDVMADMRGIFWGQDWEQKRDGYAAAKLPSRLTFLDAYLRANASHEHWAGPSLTYCDVMAWAVLNTVQAMAPEALHAHEALCHFKSTFEARPDVASYLDSPGRPRTFTLPMASFGGTPETSGR